MDSIFKPLQIVSKDAFFLLHELMNAAFVLFILRKFIFLSLFFVWIIAEIVILLFCGFETGCVTEAGQIVVSVVQSIVIVE